MQDEHIAWFEELGIDDVPRVGGKNASLGEMVGTLRAEGVRVPDGFATTAFAYRQFITANGIANDMAERLTTMKNGTATLQQTGAAIRRLFLDSDFPPEISSAIRQAYSALSERIGTGEASVAVRSSATAEDLPQASFAGQQETFLNVRGERALIDACRRCYASLFTDRAISYRETQGFDHMEVALSIGVQHMVRSDLAGSGVMFSIDTETGFPDVAVISAAWGLGETVVQGAVDPDKYLVFKPLLVGERLAPIIERTLGAKERKMIYATGGSTRTATVETTHKERQLFVLDDAEILELARWAVTIEQHYRKPMDMEWAKDGDTGKLYIVQARPETIQASRKASELKTYWLKEAGTPILSGSAIGEAIASGTVCAIRDAADIERFVDGAILVTSMTDPDWVPIMKRAAGIITDHGGTTSHAAIVSRELGVPAIVGTGRGTEILHDGREITLSCAEGDQGVVYDGILPFETSEVDLSNLPKTNTAMMVNVASPAAAFHWWRLPTQGVGLARMEFIINTLIKIHPMALIHPDRVDGAAAQHEIRALTRGYQNPIEFFVETLALGIAKLAAPYHPHPVIVRLSGTRGEALRKWCGASASSDQLSAISTCSAASDGEKSAGVLLSSTFTRAERRTSRWSWKSR